MNGHHALVLEIMDTRKPHLQGITVFITGATDGIGKETALQLAQLGASIVFTTRSEEKGRRVRDELIRASSNQHIDFLHCELGSFSSIRKCCSTFLGQHDSLKVLLNNAGVFHGERMVTSDGIEATFAINYLAPFLTTQLLLPSLMKGAPSRIINVTSGLHGGTIKFDDIEFIHGYNGWEAYRQSKLALTLFTKYLATKLAGKEVTVNCVNPKMTRTHIGDEAGLLFRTNVKLSGRDPVESAATVVYLVCAPELERTTGQYFVDKEIKSSLPGSDDMGAARRLWEISERYMARVKP